jgi:RNA polymerase sigma-70 factor, ECF subfamily
MAKDLISETVLKAYEKLHDLRDEKAFLSFLFGIASNILKKQYRREKFSGVFDWLMAESAEDPSTDPERDMDTVILYEAIRKLPPEYQEAIVLHCISGFPLQEVADIQGSTLAATKVRVMRAKQRLAKMLTAAPHTLNVITNQVS